MRLLAPSALLYTDMQTCGAVLNHPARALNYHAMEHPLALQLGGSCPRSLAACAAMAEQHGYDEINLNLGCPSDRVQAGRFGACLMAEPEQVARCITAMKRAVSIPVTAKTRIGIDHQDSYDFFASFVGRLVDAGCDKIIVHARKAWLKGLSPRQNRTVPPLHYAYVYQVKQTLPNVPVILNGHIKTVEEIQAHLQKTDGVMLGRLACDNAYAIAEIHNAFYPEQAPASRADILQKYFEYLVSLPGKVPLSLLIKPLLSLAHGLPTAKKWREKLTQIQRTGKISDFPSMILMLSNMENANFHGF